jgi:hypothetical protein
MSKANEGAALGYATFWDERYVKAEDSKPTHEWFRDFGSLEPFLTKHLFETRNPESKPKILHLGSVDSVCTAHCCGKLYYLLIDYILRFAQEGL